MFSHIGHAAGHAEALSEGSGGHIDEIEAGSGMTFKVTVQLTKFGQILNGELTGHGVGGIKDRRSVAFRQNEAVVASVLRLAVVIPSKKTKKYIFRKLASEASGATVTV